MKKTAALNKCDICTDSVDKPTAMNFVGWGGKEVHWLICDACTLTLTNFIKRMAAKAETTK